MRAMKKIIDYFRVIEWYDSKIPFMLCGYIFNIILAGDRSVWDISIKFILYFIYLAAFLSFSYLINDYSDMEADKKAGKKKVIFDVDKRLTTIILILLPICGVVPLWICLSFNMLYIGLTVVVYFLGAAYSIPLFRFKERGFIGLLECSVAQRCIPLLVIPFLVDSYNIYFVLWIVISFIDGIRYLVIHQYIDRENDLKAGVRTFVLDYKINAKKLLITLFIVESAFFLFIFFKLFMINPYMIAFLVFYIIYERIISIVVTKYMKVEWFCSFLAVPLEDLFNVFLLMIVLLYLDTVDLRFLPLTALGVLLTIRCFIGKTAFVKVFIESKLRRR